MCLVPLWDRYLPYIVLLNDRNIPEISTTGSLKIHVFSGTMRQISTIYSTTK